MRCSPYGMGTTAPPASPVKFVNGHKAGEIQCHRARRQTSNDQDEGEGKDQITAEVGQFGGDLDTIVIEKCLDSQDNRHEDELVPEAKPGNIHAKRCAEEQILEEDRVEQHIHRGNHADQTNQVEPGSRPAPGFSTEMGTPVIQTARRREGGCDLPHAKSNGHCQRRRRSTRSRTAPPGPAALKAAGKAEMPPARIQMIENEIAKFENPLMRRASSWAYPILCSTCLSCSCTLSVFFTHA